MKQLQKMIGNQAVIQAIQKGSPSADTRRESSPQAVNNKTGMPDQLKAGIERLSGLSMDDVRVHYNSSKPSELHALAYTQGSEIHIEPGQEKHLAHEAWHVVQQKQGRVAASKQFKGTAINDNPALEQEADRMGARAQGYKGTAFFSEANAPSSISAVEKITQLFADDYNKQRLIKARNTSKVEAMQLDHAVSQNTMRKLYEAMESIKLIALPAKNLYTHTKQAYIDFITKFDEMDESVEHEDPQTQQIKLKSILPNIRNNISPGFKITTGNPGSDLDPQIEMDRTGAISFKGARNKYLLELDNNIRWLSRLPIPKQDKVNSEDEYNEKLDVHLGAILNAITHSLDEIIKGKEPVFDSSIWYRNGKDEVAKYVKRVSAEWIKDEPTGMGGVKLPDLAETSLSWSFLLPSYNFKKNELSNKSKKQKKYVYEDDLTVNVSVKVPLDCWKHIYERHYIPTFAYDVQAINTFWKEDPQTAITSELLEKEINLLIDRKFNLRNLEDGYVEDIINEFVEKLFFQGLVEVDRQPNQVKVEVELKSIAPQDHTLGYGIEPNILRESEKYKLINKQ